MCVFPMASVASAQEQRGLQLPKSPSHIGEGPGLKVRHPKALLLGLSGEAVSLFSRAPRGCRCPRLVAPPSRGCWLP